LVSERNTKTVIDTVNVGPGVRNFRALQGLLDE